MPDSASHTVRIIDHELQFACLPGQSVLRGMERVAGKAIPVGCRNGGCGVCRIEVVEGDYSCGRMSRACVTAEEETRGIALACKVIPESPLAVRVIGRLARRIAAPDAR